MKKMRKKKGIKKAIFTLELITAAAISLAGCGQKAENSNVSQSVVTASEGGTTQASEEKQKLTMWMDLSTAGGAHQNTLDDTLYWKQIEENTGIDVEWQHPASGQGTEQFNLIVAGDKLPDIMYYKWLYNYPGGPDAAIADGKIIALNEWIDQYAPNFKAFLEKHPDLAKDITSDSGNIFYFPFIYTKTPETSDSWKGTMEREACFESYVGPFVREDWLDELGMDVPVTLDDWYTMLKAFKEKKGAEYPLSFVAAWGNFGQTFASAYDVTLPRIGVDATTAFILKEDGTLGYSPAEPGYKEYLKFMNRLYEEGLLDPDFMVQDAATVDSKILMNKTGATIYMTPIGNLGRQAKAENPESTLNMVGVANPVKEEGQQLRYFQASYPNRGEGAAITTSCKDVKTAVQLLDYLWSEECDRLINWGIEGVSYEMKDGWPEYTQERVDKIISGDTVDVERHRMLNGPFAVDSYTRTASKRNYTLKEGEVDQILVALDIWAKNGTTPAGLPPTTLLPDEASVYAAKFNEVSTYTDEMFAKFIMGQESLDNFDKYVEVLYSLGLQDVLDIQSAALERYQNR